KRCSALPAGRASSAASVRTASSSVAPNMSAANTRRRSLSARSPTSSRVVNGDVVIAVASRAMEALDFSNIERWLVIMAHPDDVDFGFAGTVATLTDAGIEVSYCIVTDGDAGGSEYGVARGEMGSLRRDEQRAAAAIVGVHDVHFLGYPDGRVEATLEL